MIYLNAVSKAVGSAKALKLVLQPTDLVVPTDRRVVVLGDKDGAKSMLLDLLVGGEKPTRGHVLTDVRLSPIYRYGVLFQRRLSLLQNVRFFARMLRVNADDLFLELCSICGHHGRMAKSAKAESGDLRRRMELAMLGLLPFECYVFEDLWSLSDSMRDWFFRSAAARHAGVIFGVNQPRVARTHADCALVVRDGIVYPFSSVEEGVAFNERG